MHRVRKGIAMIELIFAIVIMGIVLMSAPMLISQATQSNMTAFQQESIAMVASHANTVMTYAWDENNTDGNNAILTVTNGDTDLDQNSPSTLRGTTTAKLPAQKRLRRFGGRNASIQLGRDSDSNGTQDNLDDIDDFIVKPLTLTIYGNSNQADKGEYIDLNVSIKTDVDYGNDAAGYTVGGNSFSFSKPFDATHDMPTGQTTNIKRIITTLTSTSPNADFQSKKIVLKSFMCNIGATGPLQKGGY